MSASRKASNFYFQTFTIPNTGKKQLKGKTRGAQTQKHPALRERRVLLMIQISQVNLYFHVLFISHIIQFDLLKIYPETKEVLNGRFSYLFPNYLPLP